MKILVRIEAELAVTAFGVPKSSCQCLLNAAQGQVDSYCRYPLCKPYLDFLNLHR